MRDESSIIRSIQEQAEKKMGFWASIFHRALEQFSIPEILWFSQTGECHIGSRHLPWDFIISYFRDYENGDCYEK